jgi:TonB family protein
MLPPIAEAIDFLHQKEWIHGRIKPSNILAVNDQLRVSIDGLVKNGERPAVRSKTDAPELPTADFSCAADAWSLGSLLVTAFHPTLVAGETGAGREPSIPSDIPPPYREIAQRSLHPDSKQRCAVSGILATLNGSLPASQALAPPPEGSETNISGTTTAAEPAELSAADAAADESAPQHSLLRPAAILVISAAVLIGALLWARKPAVPQPSSASPESSATSSAAIQAPPPATAQPPTQASDHSQGRVLHQVLPELSRRAQRSISGRINVVIHVEVSPSGAVTHAKVSPSGPSRYFSRRSLESARRWKFAPPTLNGKAVASQWSLRFEIGKTSREAFPSQTQP